MTHHQLCRCFTRCPIKFIFNTSSDLTVCQRIWMWRRICCTISIYICLLCIIEISLLNYVTDHKNYSTNRNILSKQNNELMKRNNWTKQNAHFSREHMITIPCSRYLTINRTPEIISIPIDRVIYSIYRWHSLSIS